MRRVRLTCGPGLWKIDLAALYNIISKIRRISLLEVNCQHPEAPYFSDAPSHIHEQPLIVEHLFIRHIDEFIGHIIRRLEPIIDLTSVRSFSVAFSSLDPYISSLVQRLPRLTSILYRTSGLYDPRCLTHLHLTRLSIWSDYLIWSTHNDESYDPSRQLSQWDDVLRDLEILICTNPTALGLNLRLQEYGGLRVPADDVFEHLMKFLSRQDWERLGGILQRYTSLKTIVICVLSLKTPSQRLVPALKSLASERLPESVASLLEITSEERIVL